MKRKQKSSNNSALFALFVVVLLFGAVFSLFFVKDFVGYIGYMLNATAGKITTIVIQHQQSTGYWQGYYGLLSVDLQTDLNITNASASGGGVTNVNLVFDCFGSTGTDVYASTVWYDYLTYPILAVNASEVDDYLGADGTEYSSAANTLTRNISLILGTSNITTIGTYTKQSGFPNATDFDMFVVKDSSTPANFLFGTHINTLAVGFDGVLHNYQIMVAIPSDDDEINYYFYPDPVSDPFGTCSQVQNVMVYGTVSDKVTGQPLGNVSINLGSEWADTSETDGSYSMYAEAGSYYIIANKTGYFAHTNILNLVFGQPLNYNFTLIPSLGLGVPYGFVSGYVFDNSTQEPLANVTISSGISLGNTGSQGNYTLTAPIGIVNIVAIKEGYTTSISQNISVNLLTTTLLNISLNPAFVGVLNGAVEGTVTDNLTGLPLENVTISIAGEKINTTSQGFYAINVSAGSHVMSAIKDGYESHITEINIPALNTTYHNFTMDIFVGELTRNGTLAGRVKDSWTNASLENVTILVDGKTLLTNSSGDYSTDLPAGTYVVAAMLEHYESNISTVTINVSETTIHNISLDWSVGEIERNGTIQGLIIDNWTGVPMVNVLVSIGGRTALSNSSGAYSIDLPAGSYVLTAVKTNYEVYIADVNVSIEAVTYHNFAMDYFVGEIPRNGTIQGIVTATSTGLPLENTTVSLGEFVALTDSIGNYSFDLPAGIYNIIAIATGYNAYSETVYVYFGNTTIHNITLDSYVGGFVENGTVRGVVVENGTNLPVANATVYLGGTDRYTTTSSTGNYSIIGSAGNHFIASEKYGYKRYYGNVTITVNATTIHNITLFNLSVPKIESVIYGNITKNITKMFNFTQNLSVVINVTTNESQNNIYLKANLYTSRPEGVSVPSFLNLGKYYEFTTNISSSIITNVTFYFTYNESDISSWFNESYITAYYFNPSTMLWDEYNVTLDTGNNTLVFSSDHIPTYYLLGLRSSRVYGYVTSGGSALSNATVFASGQSMRTSATGYYLLTVQPGTQDLIAVKSGYNAYIYEFTIVEGEWLERNIALSTIYTGEAAEALGQAAAAAAAQGAFAELPMLAAIGKWNAKEYYVSESEIDEKVNLGSYLEKIIAIYNFKSEKMSISLSLSGDVVPFIKMDKTKMIIDSNSQDELKLTLLGINTPGVYTGHLILSGDLNMDVPIKLTIYDKEKLPISALVIKLDISKTSVNPGGTLRYTVDLQNLLTDRNYDVSLIYNLNSISGNSTLEIGRQTTNIKTSTSLLNEFKVPGSFELGDYMLNVEAKYLDYTSTASGLVTVKEPFYQYRLYGIIPVWFISLLLVIFASSFLVFTVVKKSQEKKKRFHAAVEYKLLPTLTERSLFVGKIAESSRRAYLDMDQLTMHTIIAGSTGGGKTISAQVLIEECLLKGVAVIVFDPTAQWSGMLRKCQDAKMLGFYSQFGLKSGDARAFNGNIRNIKNAREVIDLTKYMKPGEIQILTINQLDPKDIDLFVGNTVREIFHAKIEETNQLKVLIVYDEVHRLLPKFGGSGQGMLQIERACREARKWGIGIMLISQVLADFVGQIKANISTEIQMKTRDEGDLARINMKYGEEYIHGLVKAPVGSGMVQNSAFNRGIPYYVTFRPILHSVIRLEDDELAKYNKYNEMVDDIEFQLEQLEEMKQDIFDMKLELKLARDKIKTGNFNMVQIYIDGLAPRVQKMWDKLGKKPKERKIKLIDEATLMEELEKAKKARAEYEEQQKAAGVKEDQGKKLEIKEKTPEEVQMSMKAISELMVQINDCITRKDKDRAVELYNELPPIIVRFPKDKKEEQQKRFDDTKSKIYTFFNIQETPKEQSQAGEEGAAQATAQAAGESSNAPDISAMLKDADDSLENNNIQKAKEIYSKLLGLYKSASPDMKKEIYPKAIELNKKIAEKGR